MFSARSLGRFLMFQKHRPARFSLLRIFDLLGLPFGVRPDGFPVVWFEELNPRGTIACFMFSARASFQLRVFRIRFSAQTSQQLRNPVDLATLSKNYGTDPSRGNLRHSRGKQFDTDLRQKSSETMDSGGGCGWNISVWFFTYLFPFYTRDIKYTAEKIRFIYSKKEIARPQTQFPHSCVWRNWEWGRAVSFLGIFFSNFQYTVFAVYWQVWKKWCKEDHAATC